MRMKRILLASSALAVLAGAQQANAASDMYVSVFGGANFISDAAAAATYYSTSSISIDGDTGFVIGAAIGTKLDNWAKGLRAEVEVSYRRNDAGGLWTTSSGSTGGFHDSNLSTFAILANVWYDIDIGSKVRPYIGGGVGWGRTQSEGAFIQTFTSSGTVTPNLDFSASGDNSGFTWQLGAGFNYEVAPDVDVGLGYRYFNGPEFTYFGRADLDNENHAVQVNLTVGIN